MLQIREAEAEVDRRVQQQAHRNPTGVEGVGRITEEVMSEVEGDRVVWWWKLSRVGQIHRRN
jgi:hypothetical protein